MASATIFHQYLTPVRSVADYAGDLDKAEANKLELTAKRRANLTGEQDLQEKNALRALLSAGVDLNTPEGQAKLYATAPGTAGTILKQRSEIAAQSARAGRDTAQGGLAKTQTDVANQKLTQEKRDKAVQDFASFSSPADALASLERHAAAGDLPAPMADQFRQQLQQLNDPMKFREWQLSMIRGIMTPKDQMAYMQPNANTVANNAQSGANTSATVQGANQRHITMTPYQQGQLNEGGVKTLYDTGINPLNGGGVAPPAQGAPSAPAALQPTAPAATQGFPRISPQQQGAADQQAIQIIAQKYLQNPQEMQRIDQNIAQAQAAISGAPVEMRGVLQRDIAGMQMAKQMAGGGGGSAVTISPAAGQAQPQSQKAKDALIVANNKQNPQGKPLPTAALKMQQDEMEAIGISDAINADLKAVSRLLDDKSLNLGPVKNLANQARNYVGASNTESKNLATFKATLEKLRNDSLRLNKGVQTEGDALRAWNEILANINDPGVVKQRLEEVQNINQRAVNMRKMNIDAIRRNYGHDPLDTTAFEAQAQVPAVGASKSSPKNSGGWSVVR